MVYVFLIQAQYSESKTTLEIEFLQMTLYKSVLVNVIKWMKKHSFCGACLSINTWNLES